MANQGPKVEKVTKGGKEKKPPKEKKPREKKIRERASVNPEEQDEQGAPSKTGKTQDKTEKKERQAAAKAEKAKQKAAAKEEKAAAKEERAAKKRTKSEKAKAVKISREGEEEKPAGKKKKLILAAVVVVLVLLIAVSIFFLIRMLRGGSKETTASLPDSSVSAPVPVQGGAADGKIPAEENEEPEAPKDREEEPAASSEKEKDQKKPEKKEGKDASSVEPSSQKDSSASSSETPASSAAEKTLAPEDGSLQKEAAAQAVEGSAGTANIAAMLGSGAVPVDQRDITEDMVSDKPKPGQIVAQTANPGEGGDAASRPAKDEPKRPEAAPDKGTALTPPTKTQEVPDFKFSEASLNLPPFHYSAANALEGAVHRDIGEFLAKKDDRPGTQITSVVIGGTIRQPDGSLRVLAYAWGSRYAIAESTLFDYGNLVGPCAIDYSADGSLQKITLARAGDAFESSVREFCGGETQIADKMVSQAYDLELRGQMLRNVSNYISQNNIPVDFFRASGQVYNRDGSIYLPPEMQNPPEEGAEDGEAQDSLQDQYRMIQDMPE